MTCGRQNWRWDRPQQFIEQVLKKGQHVAGLGKDTFYKSLVKGIF